MNFIPSRPAAAPRRAFELSAAQEGLWTAELLDPGSSANVTGQYSDIHGTLDMGVFERASRQVIEETEALRLRFGGAADRPLQWVAPLAPWSLPVTDLSGEADPYQRALHWMAAQHARPLDLESGRAFRWALLRLGAARFVWSFQVHHLLMDGFSRNAVWRRLGQVYSACASGVAAQPGEFGSLGEHLAQYGTYARSPNFEADRRYFATLLTRRPRYVSLSGKPAPATREFRRATVHLPRHLSDALRALVAGSSLAHVFTAAAALLQRSEVGGDDLVLGLTVGARLGPSARRTPSMLSNTVPLRLRVSADISIGDLIARAVNAIGEVKAHQRYPSQALRQDVGLTPLDPNAYGLVVNFMPFDQGTSFSGHPASTHNLSNGPVADLTIGVFDNAGQTDIRVDLNGNRELYDDSALARHLDHLVAFLTAIARGPLTRPIGTLFAGAGAPVEARHFDAIPDAAFLGPRFDIVAGERGDAVALVDGSRRVTYRELLRRAAALTAALQSRGVGPGDRVGIALPRSADMVVAVVGIVRSGAAYVPVDLLHPPDRRSLILADARLRLVVSDGAAPGIPAHMEMLPLPPSDDHADPGPAIIPSPSDAAYIIYTSGSTGRPNGVRVTQRNVARLFRVTQPLYDFGASDVWSLFHSLAFDVSVFELWGALLTGGRLVVVPAETAKASDAFHELILREGVTVLSQTPSAFRAFDAADAAAARPGNDLRLVIFAGEMLDPRTLKGWFDAHGDQRPRLANMYGITETTVHTTYRAMRAADARGQGHSLIGVPLADLRMDLLDEDGMSVADGQVGEIWVSGAGVTSGYIERPELTARRFLPDPRRGGDSLRYRSGDLARRLPDGGFEYLGRADQQVKLRGFRVELGEIEAALRESPSVRDAVVALREDPEVGPRLIAYVVTDDAASFDPEAMRLRLIRRLPEYMVPAAYVRIEQIPRTVNDKVDRKGLPAPGEQDFPADDGAEPPRDERERTVAAIFAAVLARPVQERDSDFFRLGGHSLLAVRATLLCRERLRVELPIRALFENPTVAGLAAAVREAQKLGRPRLELAHAARGASVALSPQQRALWLEVQLRADDGIYNVPVAFSVTGPPDPVRLRMALAHVAQSHEVLRGRLVVEGDGPCLLLDRDPADVELDWADARQPLQDFAHALRRPFDLELGPLWRCVVRPLPDGAALIAVVVHHLIIDAAGLEVLLRELTEAYAQPDRQPSRRRYDFADLAAYENDRLAADREDLERYWTDALDGVESPELPPPLLPCPPGEEFASVRALRALSPDLTARVRELAAEFGTTPFHVFFAAYLALLRIYTSRDDLVVGSLVSLRDSPAAEGVVGYLLGPVALRMELRPAETFRQTVAGLVRRWHEVRENARLPMDLLVRTASKTAARLESGSPFQLFFSLLEEPAVALRLGEHALTPIATSPASAKFKMFLQVEHHGPAATLALEFQRGVLDPESGARLLGHLETLLLAATTRPDAKVADLSLLAPAECATLAAWAVNPSPYPKGSTVTDLFEEMARTRPEAAALIDGALLWNYRELDERANSVAWELRKLGVERGHRVPLLLPRGATFIACALGVLKAGATYVPLDPDLPAERRGRLLQGLHATVAISVDGVPAAGAASWLDASVVDARMIAPPHRPQAAGDDAVYVMFTSGSTGEPKAVEVAHRGVVRLVRGQEFARMSAHDAWLHLSPTSFDASTLEIWAPLLNGGRCIVVEGRVPTPAVLAAVIAGKGATSAWFTSSLFNALIDEDPACLSRLTQILTGGEALSPAHVRRAIDRLPGVRLVNGYGPTENTTFTCCHSITRADTEPGRSVPIGRPIANTTARVLDRDGKAVPIGVAGELVAGGDGVALRYLGKPDADEPRFEPDPESRDPGALRYRTGDRVRWRSDGVLEFLGRFDEQLKINGHRIEPGEIAAVLAEHPGVRHAAVVARRSAAGDSHLVAYVVPREEREPQDLFAQLARQSAERLPYYMQTGTFIRVTSLPLTPNGKLDTAALPPLPVSTAPAGLPEHAESQNRGTQPGDEAVLALIGEVLGQPVSRRDNLYALGADSLRMIRVLARLKSRLGLDLSVGEVTKRGAVADILRLAADRGSQAEDERAAPTSDELPLCSPWQVWLWRMQLLNPHDATAVVFRALRAAAPIDADVLERSLRALLDRHQALRCRLVGAAADQDPRLELRPAEEFVLRRAQPLGARRLADARTCEHSRPFDLSAELPVRVTLQPDADRHGESELWVSVHHIAYDGASEEIFWRELQVIFKNLASARPALTGLDPLRASFLDLAQRQRAALDERNLDVLERHWQKALAGAPERLVPSWRTAAPVSGNETCQVRLQLPAQLVQSLRSLGRERHTSIATLSLAAFESLLWRWSGERDQVIALDFAGRVDEYEEDQIGLFTSPVAVRADLAGDPPLLELADRNRTLLADALSHRIPFERVVAALGAGRRRFAGFRIFFSHLSRSAQPSLGGTPLREVPPGVSLERTDLRLMIEELPDELCINLAGGAALFDPGDLTRLANALLDCLTQLCRRPETRLSELEWLSESDRAQLARWNSTAAHYPRDQTLTALLHAQAARTPSAIAIEVGDLRVTYAELFQRARALASRLRHAGVSSGARVGLYLDRHPTLPQAMLAILEAGGAYVPLDPTFPRERLAFMLEDARVCAIVTRRALLAELPPQSAPVICIDAEAPTSQAAPEMAGWQPADASSLAYVLYTSGSTGRPKGVGVEHRQLVNFLTSMALNPGMKPDDALLAVTSVSFDIAGLEIWLPLLCGARICLAGREEVADAALLRHALERSGATMLQATPSTWRALLASGWTAGPGFKALVGGETLPADLAELLTSNCRAVWNMYGPTETTIWSSTWRLPQPAGPVRVGKPIANTELHVLDDALRPLPIGVSGELFIGGEGVARGYLNRAELNEQRFLDDPFRGGAARMYRTGDLARWLPDGTLDLLGRADDQLKVRGHRIEPGEVEAALQRLPAVAQAAVALHRPDVGDPRLVAYLVPERGVELPKSAELRAQLRQWLVEYMLPYHFVELVALPLTPNGKVDRRQLGALIPEAGTAVPADATPSAAASALEGELITHFAHSVGAPVTVDTDFFEAGGDSLGVLRLISRVSQERGVELSSAELFLHSTPRRMAARLEQLLAGAARLRHLVRLRRGTSRESIVLVHPVGGHLAAYGRLAHHLHPSVTLFGLQAAGIERTYESIEQRCAAYVGEVTAAWSGPLILCGYSLGGALAVEMAEQLRRAGRSVSMVLLLDSGVPRPFKRGWAKFSHRATELRRFSWRDRYHWLTGQLSRRFLKAPADADGGEAAALVDSASMERLIAQALRWRSPTYPGKVQLYRADRNMRGYPNPLGPLGWDQYCAHLDVVNFPCDHAEILAEPQVLRIIAELESLIAADSEPTTSSDKRLR